MIEYAPAVPLASSLRPFAARAARLLAFASLTLVAACGAGVPSAETPMLEKPVPVALTADDGAPAPIPIPGAGPLVLDFWSPTCEPCKRTIPAMLAKRAEIEAKEIGRASCRERVSLNV